jgi:hypothetical protein
MYKAEARANRKARAARAKKVRGSRFNPYRERASSPQDRRIGGFYPVQSTGTRRISPGLCFACGKAGHWKGAPECAANISNNKISTYYVNSAISYVSSADTECGTGESILNMNIKFKNTLKAEGLVKSDMDEVCKISEKAPEVHVELYSDDVILIRM